MSTREENEQRENRQRFEEFLELYRHLSRWQRVQFHLSLQSSALRRRWGRVAWDWLIFQWEIDEKIKAARAGIYLPSERDLSRLRYEDD